MNFAIEFFVGWQNIEWLQKNNYLQEKKKHDRISLLQFRIIEFYFEKSFPPSDKYPEIQ
jgi:hypothetical protein